MAIAQGKTAVRSQSSPTLKSTPREQRAGKDGSNIRGHEGKVEFSKAKKA